MNFDISNILLIFAARKIIKIDNISNQYKKLERRRK